MRMDGSRFTAKSQSYLFVSGCYTNRYSQFKRATAPPDLIKKPVMLHE